mgnify:CR=1 FL=1
MALGDAQRRCRHAQHGFAQSLAAALHVDANEFPDVEIEGDNQPVVHVAAARLLDPGKPGGEYLAHPLAVHGPAALGKFVDRGIAFFL